MKEKDSNKISLNHFLRLAQKQIQFRMKSAKPEEIENWKIIEELILEQIPNENTRRSVGSSR